LKRIFPKVYLVGETKTNDQQLREYLEDVGAPDWVTDDSAHENGQELTEVMSRSCYRSFAPGLNPNVTRVREGNDKHLKHILKVGHGSVLEHAQTNWIFKGVSRVFTHELCRHRVGTAISQESLRFVRLDALEAWLPSCLAGDPWAVAKFYEVFEYLEGVQRELAEHFQLDEPGTPFEAKKEITSAMRRMAPIGLATTMGWSANFRSLRHVIEMRTSGAAEEEIRLVIDQVARICQERWPSVFGDYERVELEDGTGVWSSPYRKV